MDCYPAAHYAMINAFYSHCSRFAVVYGMCSMCSNKWWWLRRR